MEKDGTGKLAITDFHECTQVQVEISNKIFSNELDSMWKIKEYIFNNYSCLSDYFYELMYKSMVNYIINCAFERKVPVIGDI